MLLLDSVQFQQELNYSATCKVRNFILGSFSFDFCRNLMRSACFCIVETESILDCFSTCARFETKFSECMPLFCELGLDKPSRTHCLPEILVEHPATPGE